MLPFTRIVRALPPTVPFVPPEALERQQGQPLALRVGANESNFGISPRARQAMVEAVDQVHWYNDPEGYELRSALAVRHGVAWEEVALGAGIDEILGLLVRLFAEPGDAVVTSLGAYPTFNYHVEGHGAVLHKVPYRADREDLPALLDKARQVRPKLLYVANPDNPMGTYQRADELRDLIAELPPDCVLLLDEAYIDFAPADAHLPLDAERAQVVRLRTFSKAHGMAGRESATRWHTATWWLRSTKSAITLASTASPKLARSLRWATTSLCGKWCGKWRKVGGNTLRWRWNWD